MTNTVLDSKKVLDVAELRRTPTITIARAGEFLGVSRTTAYEMSKSGRLPTIQTTARSRRVPTAALLRLLGYEPF